MDMLRMSVGGGFVWREDGSQLRVAFGLQAAAKEKDVELQNLRRCLSELKEKADKAEPPLRLGSPDKLEALFEKNVSAIEQI